MDFCLVVLHNASWRTNDTDYAFVCQTSVLLSHKNNADYLHPIAQATLEWLQMYNFYPLRQTPDVINPTNFQLDPPIELAPWGSKLGVSQWLSKRLLQLAARMILMQCDTRAAVAKLKTYIKEIALKLP